MEIIADPAIGAAASEILEPLSTRSWRPCAFTIPPWNNTDVLHETRGLAIGAVDNERLARSNRLSRITL